MARTRAPPADAHSLWRRHARPLCHGALVRDSNSAWAAPDLAVGSSRAADDRGRHQRLADPGAGRISRIRTWHDGGRAVPARFVVLSGWRGTAGGGVQTGA